MAYEKMWFDNTRSTSSCFTRSKSDTGVLGNIVTHTNGVYNAGQYLVNRWNKTRNFKPGVVSVNPIEHIRNKSVSTQLPQTLLPANRSFSPNRGGTIIWGNVAGLVNDTQVGYTLVGAPLSTDVGRNLAKAYAKITMADMDYGLFLAELRETLAMLRNPFSGIRKLTHDLRRSCSSRSGKLLKDFFDASSQQWLEYRYGIRPLVMDAQAIMKQHDAGIRSFEGKVLSKTSREVVKRRQTFASPIYMYQNVNYMFCFTYQVKQYQWNDLTARVLFTRDHIGHDQLYALGLHPATAVSVIWELIPYSFVVDWFVNVGDWLAMHQPKPGISVHANTAFFNYCTETTVQVLMGTYWYQNGFSWVPLNHMQTVTHCSAARSVNVPLPAFPAVNPDIQNYKRTLDSLSLLWQNMPKLIKR